MEVIINDIVKLSQKNSFEQTEPDTKKETQKKEILKCIVWEWIKCHPDFPLLFKEQITIIREKISKSNKTRSLKECNHPTFNLWQSYNVYSKQIHLIIQWQFEGEANEQKWNSNIQDSAKNKSQI